MEKKRSLEGLIFISPWLIGFALFFANSIFVSLRLSVSEITRMRGFEMKFIGFANYQNAFFYDVNFVPMFLKVVKDTLLNTPITLVFAFFIAMLINRPIAGRGFFRTVFFLPVLLGTGYVMKQLLGLGVGTDAMAAAKGIMMPKELIKYLGPSFSTAISEFLGRITIVLWKAGVQIILFLAGLQGISSSLYEAAHCDGCTEWEAFWKITLPMMTPVILLNFIYTIIDSFTDSNNPIVDYILDVGFRQTQFAYGTAMGWIFFMFVFIICMLVFLIMRRFTYNAGEK